MRLIVPTDPRLRAGEMAEVVRGVELAIEERGADLLGKKVVLEQPDADPRVIAGASDDPDVLGLITSGAGEAIAASRIALASSQLPVFELTDDLYDAGEIFGPVFQMAAPHSWQAFRLMRYFGPGDRGYGKVVVIHDASRRANLGLDASKEAAQIRGVQVLEAAGTPDQAARGGVGLQPDAVVVAGSTDFVRQVVEILSHEVYRYGGRAANRQGGRPQVAGFSMMLSLGPPPGTVAAGDYAAPAQSGDIIEPVARFRSSFKAKFGKEPSGIEMLGYDAACALMEAAKRAGTADHAKVIAELERYDRVRFGHLPLSFGPTDHVGAERDVLGLWAVPADPDRWKGIGTWRHLMRTFTSDLERTNILEDDWGYFFNGATPGGEAPFFHTSRWGITSDRSDPLH